MRKSTAAILTIFVAVPLVALIVFNLFFEKVPIDRVGVRVNQFSGVIDPEDLKPGYVFVAPFQHRLLLMDATYQTLTLVEEDAFKLRLRDGFQTVVDVTLIYRLRPGEAHKAIERHGSGERFKTILKKIADKYVWDVMTELVTEDFYNTNKRHGKSIEARNKMNAELEEERLEVIDVLIRDIQYDQGFEELLRRKQKLDQERLLLASQRQLAEEQMATELIERETANKVIKINEEREKEMRELVADMDAEIAKVKAQAEREAKTMIAEAQSTGRQMIAEGELAKVRARAEGEKAINDAYNVPGGELYLARQMVQNLSFGDIEINTNQTNPFDVSQMLGMIGVDLRQAIADEAAARAEAREEAREEAPVVAPVLVPSPAPATPPVVERTTPAPIEPAPAATPEAPAAALAAEEAPAMAEMAD